MWAHIRSVVSQVNFQSLVARDGLLVADDWVRPGGSEGEERIDLFLIFLCLGTHGDAHGIVGPYGPLVQALLRHNDCMAAQYFAMDENELSRLAGMGSRLIFSSNDRVFERNLDETKSLDC